MSDIDFAHTDLRVSEDDPSISAAFVELEREGCLMRAYFAEPISADDTTPSIVLAMHLWGVNGEQRNTARRFAKEGIAIIVPDLYARFDAPSGDEGHDTSEFLPFAKKLSKETVEPDIQAATMWIKQRFSQGKVGIAGFCMGGTIALLRTMDRAETYSAAAIWYGSLADVALELIDVPIVASYGAEDHGIPLQTVEALQNVAVATDVKIYEGARHAFFDIEGSAFKRDAADDSWRRSIAFLTHHLRLSS
ncbi:MAG TPA: dienelactone hydrolase family protein [Candidatus Elarobacter sp.]|nr:dienelactone hydrolase family protein [Candidatus Elarobacter sp.]